MELQALFGNIDIYLFDQLLRGRIQPGMHVLDAGCGGGRNLVYLLKNGFDVSAADAAADVVISNAVLHFARNDEHFDAMVRGMWRVLKPGGMLFCRLASTIGMEGRFRHISGRRFQPQFQLRPDPLAR